MFSISETEPGRNGQPKITLKSPDDAYSCDIYVYGATITSWRHAGVEKLFCSPNTPFDGVTAIRGGIPVVFPQFGRPDETMPQHGFARTSMWTIHERVSTDASCRVEFKLMDSDATRFVWPHAFTLTYTVSLSPQGLRTVFKATHAGDKPFTCQALLHTYLAVPRIEDVRVRGLTGLAVFDKMSPVTEGAELPKDSRDVAVIDQEVDRIYLDPGVTQDRDGDDFVLPVVEVMSGEQTLVKVQRKALIVGSEDGPRTLPVDCVLWNAWIAKSKAIVDLEDDAYLRYVCVEPGICSRYESVESQHSLVLDQFLTV
jgi:glucose-6-phosphate 1-epimerase